MCCDWVDDTKYGSWFRYVTFYHSLTLGQEFLFTGNGEWLSGQKRKAFHKRTPPFENRGILLIIQKCKAYIVISTRTIKTLSIEEIM